VVLALNLAGSAPALAAVTFSEAANKYEPGLSKAVVGDLRELAESGDTRAQYYYGVELMRGDDVARDLVQGYAWIEIAADCAATCSSAEASALAQDGRLKLQHFLSGTQLLEAERIAESFLTPRREAHRRAVDAAEQALTGKSIAEGVALHPGCAAQALDGCEVGPHREAGRTSCGGVVANPDRLPADRGPHAQVRAPKYPASAREASSEGRVVIGAHVDYTGFVCQATIISSSGNDEIDRAALEALLKWRLQPAVEEGRAVDALFTETFDFSFWEHGAP
jgi:TonB family protein